MKKQMFILIALLLSLSMMAKKQTTPLAITEEEHSYEQKEEKPYRHHIEVSYTEFFFYWFLPNFHTNSSGLANESRPSYQNWSKDFATNAGSHFYRDYAEGAITVPPIQVGYYYQVLDWLQVGGDVGATVSGETRIYMPTGETVARYVDTYLFIAPGVRFNYYHKKIVDLYSGCNLGTMVVMANTESDPLVYSNASFAWQVTALGLCVGKHVYGKIEIGYGYKGMFNIGIGGRF